MPAVSVVIPTFNRARLLARAIASVLTQTFRDFELLVVDDCSTDGTSAMVARHDDPRIRYLRRDAKGTAGAARNTGLHAARSDLICFLDDDDEYLPDFLAEVTRAFAAAGPSAAFGWCGVETVRDGASGTYVSGREVWHPPARDRAGVHEALLGIRAVGTNCGFTVRRSVLERVGDFDERLPAVEDADYLIRLSREFDPLVVPAILVRVHLHQGPRLTTPDARMLEAYELLFAKHREEIQRHRSLLALYHCRTGWLQYRAGHRHAGRAHLVEALRARPLYAKAWLLLVRFEVLRFWKRRLPAPRRILSRARAFVEGRLSRRATARREA